MPIDPPRRRRALMLINPNARLAQAPLDGVMRVFDGGGIDVAVERFGSAAASNASVAKTPAV